jgi:4-hydroxybutyryl-CoA dehydratase / vinylacetyl-CoA-Delta-isomerase
MKTGKEYIESIKAMNFELYIDGGKITNIYDHPQVRPAIDAVAETYDFAFKPELKEQFLTTSHLTGETISRFQHVPQSKEDLIRKVSITRYANRYLGCCSFRCAQNIFAPLLHTTGKIDKDKGTHYHENALNWIKRMQQEDLLGCPAITDPKGDRRIQASKQSDPEMYLRVVDKNKDGIVLRGAKLCQTGAILSHEKLVLPCTTHRAGDEDYAVVCAVPGDAPGLIHISVRQPQDDRRKEGAEIDLGNIKYGVHECVVIFNDVFVPWERVFMCGEVEYLDEFNNMFGACHRPTTGGCKSGWADVLIAATELMAANNGLRNASHVKDKLADMIAISETMFSCGIAAAARGFELPGSGFLPDPVLANNAKYYISKAVYDLIRLAEDITGGILACCPSEKELKNPEIAHYLERFVRGVDGTPAEHRIRIVRLIENISWGLGSILHSATHGGGSGQACKMLLYEFSQVMPYRKEALLSAKRLCGMSD